MDTLSPLRHIAERQAAVDRPAPSSAPVSGAPVKLLVLEDVESDAELALREVRKAGLKVVARVVATRGEFIKALDEFAPDVILSDYNLPDIDGLAAVKIVRARDANLPFILVTGALSDDAAVELTKAGITDYCLKDRLARLGSSVQHALQQVAEIRRRHQAEAARDALARIVETARCAIVATDLQGSITSWNPGSERILGYSASEIAGQPVDTLFPADARAEARTMATRAANGEELPSLDSTLVAKDGRLIAVSLTISPIRSHGGEIVGLSTIAFDLTARQVAEQSLKEEKAFTDAIIESLPGTFYVLDQDGRHIRWNEAERKLAGLPEDRMLHSSVLDVVHSEDRKEAADKIKEVFATGHSTVEARIVDPAGTISEFLLTGRLLEIGSDRYLVGHGLDITDRRRAVDQLKAATLYTRNLIEAGLDPMVVIDAQGRISDVNEATILVTGRSREELVGSEFADHITEPEKARAGYREVFSRGFVSELPLALRHASGKVTEVLCNANVYRDERGNVAGIVVSARDITERKSREDDFARLHEQVVATVAELRQRERNVALIDTLNETLQTCNTRAEAYPLIAMTGQQLFPNASGALAVQINQDHDLETVAQWGEGQPPLAAEFGLDDCWGLRRGHIHELEAVGKGPLCTHFSSPPAGSYLCVPLSVHGEGLGLLHLALEAGKAMDDNMRRLVGTFGVVIKLSLSNLKLRESLREKAIHDSLTGLYNRHVLNEMFSREIHRAARHKSPLCVAMLDIDHFKMFNDVHGHDAGDAVLRALGKVLRDSMRGSDVAFRYGGEEFGLLLSDADLEGSAKWLDRLRDRLKSLQITHKGKVLPTFTVSAGIALAPEHGTTIEQLLAAADHAMYAAKAGGRDCVRVYNPAEPRSVGNGRATQTEPANIRDQAVA